MHLNKKDLIDFADGSLDNKAKLGDIAAHLISCPKCNRRSQSIKKIVSPSRSSKKAPPKVLLSRILLTHDRIAFSTKKRKVPFLTRNIRSAVAIASIIVAGLIVLVVNNYIPDATEITALHIEGSAVSNLKALESGNIIKQGSRLKTGKKSLLALQVKGTTIHAGAETSLVIKKAHVDKKNGKTTFDLVLDMGKISVVSDPDNNQVFTFITPHTKISSHGSQIVVSVVSDKTLVFMKQGSASLFPKSGGKVMKASEGNFYTISGYSGSYASADNKSIIEEEADAFMPDDFESDFKGK